ncbi:MAG: RIP metalloprotease RseP [Planctomycetes bacterium]|nr:RIP metalloprotease RseP [Planctomycetota bacterium]
MPNPLYVLEVVAAFGLVIFIHELGHFLAAKWCGVHVRKFAIGFGPPILKWQPGETEYSLRPIPLGGFVDLAGEHPDVDEEDNPRALWRRPAWQRVTVFSAGVVMNAVLALVLFTVAPIVGMQVPAPVLGDVLEGSPAARAGLQPGDRLVAIDGEPVLSFDDVRWEVALADPDTTFSLTVERLTEGAGQPERLTLAVTSKQSDMMPMIGIGPETEPVVAALDKRSVPAQAGLEEGDRILAVNGQPVQTGRVLNQTLEEISASPLTLTLERDGQEQALAVDPSKLVVYEFGMLPPILVTSVVKGSPADDADIRRGDRILAVEGKPWPTREALIETVEAVGEGKPVHLTLWREESWFLGLFSEAKRLEVTATPRILEGSEEPKIGVAMGDALEPPLQVGHVEPEGPAADAGLQPGDVIVAIGKDEVQPDDWTELLNLLWEAKGEPVPLEVHRGQETVTTTLRPKAVPQERLTMAGVALAPHYVPLPRILNPLVAMKRGLKQTVVWFRRVYLQLRQLARGGASPKAFGGPILIVRASYIVASYGVGTFLQFWGMISVFLAFINFLPLPPFDGGHVLFALIEGAKGKPISLKVRLWIWSVGWVALLIIFILITYQDVMRWVGGW